MVFIFWIVFGLSNLEGFYWEILGIKVEKIKKFISFYDLIRKKVLIQYFGYFKWKFNKVRCYIVFSNKNNAEEFKYRRRIEVLGKGFYRLMRYKIEIRMFDFKFSVFFLINW